MTGISQKLEKQSLSLSQIEKNKRKDYPYSLANLTRAIQKPSEFIENYNILPGF